MYCPRCGSNVGAFDFCPQCGSNVRELLESLETKENTEEPAVEETEDQASSATEEYTVSVPETDEPATEPETSAEEPEETADGEENNDETDTLFVDYLEPYSESENSLANYKKKSKLPKIIVAVLMPVIIIVSAVLAYENHFRYTTYKVPPLSKTDEYLLEEGSVPEHTIPPKVKTPKRPNIKRMLSNIDYEKKHNIWSEEETAYKYYYEICLKDKKTACGLAEYDINHNLDSLSVIKPCVIDDENKKFRLYNELIQNGKDISDVDRGMIIVEYKCYFYDNCKIESWNDLGTRTYYTLIVYFNDNEERYVETRYDKDGGTTYIVAYVPNGDYPIIVVPYKNGTAFERWYFDSDNNFVKSEKVDLSNS